MEIKKFGTKTKILDKVEFVMVAEDELRDPKCFIEKGTNIISEIWSFNLMNWNHNLNILALVQLEMPDEESEGVFMFDRDNTPIPREHFQAVVKQFKNCNHFLIRFLIKYDENLSVLTQVIS